ncbi:MAG: two-component system, OmpR family, response regulator [Acidimicrobiaceae bacterium]|jgi:DNA-binding response OmpR family regulator
MTHPRHALIVEDDESINALVTLALEVHGFTTVSTFNGAQATDAARRERFDIAIVDLVLPDQSGLEVCRRLRDGDDSLALIVLTASNTLADVERAFALGVDDFLAKPFRPRELISRMHARLGAPRSRATA